MRYTVAIVEDEPHQMETIRSLLRENFPAYDVIDVANTFEKGRDLLGSRRPDLVFLDVLLPPYTSFDILTTLETIPFEIIFITSYEEFAVRAFQLSAVDYLLKPVSLDALAKALKKFEERKMSKENMNHLKVLLDNIRSDDKHIKVALPTFKGYVLIPVSDIIRCESDNTYTTFFTKDKKSIIVSKTLKDCELMLSAHHFVRVHNSHLINMNYVVEYFKGEGGIVKMADGSQIDVSRRRKEDFLQLLRKL